jgi:LacI family transcriptional regulator
MQDVADLANVSLAAVSITINRKDSTQVSESTRKRILAAARQLNYHPNAAARQLSTASSSFVGLVADSIATTPFAGALISGAQDAAWEFDQVLLIANTEMRAKAEHEAVTMMLEHHVRGIVYSSFYHHRVDPPAELTDTPAVLANCYVTGDALPSYVPDEEQGGYLAASMLLECGHRRIGFINSNVRAPSTSGRLRGYQHALADANISFDDELVVAGSPDTEGGYEGGGRLLGLADRPSAIFCYNDRAAMGVYECAHENRLAIPDDLAVVGFDNQEIIAAHLRPGLSTIALPHYEMGYWSVRRLLDPENVPSQRSRTKLACPPVYRGSIVRQIGETDHPVERGLVASHAADDVRKRL